MRHVHPGFWGWLVLDVLAAYRLVRLAGEDRITEGLRRWAFRPPSAAWDFITCPWCLGMWVAFGVVAMTLFVGWWWWVALGLAISAALGMAAERIA